MSTSDSKLVLSQFLISGIALTHPFHACMEHYVLPTSHNVVWLYRARCCPAASDYFLAQIAQ